MLTKKYLILSACSVLVLGGCFEDNHAKSSNQETKAKAENPEQTLEQAVKEINEELGEGKICTFATLDPTNQISMRTVKVTGDIGKLVVHTRGNSAKVKEAVNQEIAAVYCWFDSDHKQLNMRGNLSCTGDACNTAEVGPHTFTVDTSLISIVQHPTEEDPNTYAHPVIVDNTGEVIKQLPVQAHKPGSVK